MSPLSEHPKEYGVLLPHFGRHAERGAMIDGAVAAERLGFDAIWVRDHLVFHPHHHEGQDPTFVDPIVALAGVATVTERIKLATGCLIPHRHPIHAALLLGSLALLAGSDRIIVGFGLGSFDHEFEIAGMGGWDRRALLEEQVEILRKLWTGETVSHSGTYYQFTDADVHPTPYGRDLPIWYSGTSLAAARRAVEYCDGWIPGRMPRRDYGRRVNRIRRLAEESGKAMIPTGVIPYTSPGPTLEAAKGAFDLGALIEEARRRYTLADGSPISELEHLDGAIIAGPPDRIAEEVRAYEEEGCNHFVFDLRLRFDDWEECLELVGTEVLPLLRSA